MWSRVAVCSGVSCTVKCVCTVHTCYIYLRIAGVRSDCFSVLNSLTIKFCHQLKMASWPLCMQVHQTHQSPHQCGHVCGSSVVLHYHGATGSPHHQH